MANDDRKTDQEKRWEKARKLLGGLKEGATVDIIRVRPAWAKGLQETIDVTEDDPVDLNYVKRTWGGQTIQLVAHGANREYLGASTITFSKPPLDHGLPLLPEDLDPQMRSLQPQQPTNGGSGNNLEMVRLILDSNRQAIDSIVSGLKDRIAAVESAPAQAAAPAPPPGSPDTLMVQLEQTTDTIEKLEEVKTRLGVDNGGMDQAITDGMQKLLDFWIAKENSKMNIELAKQKANARPPMPERPAAPPQAPPAAPPEPPAEQQAAPPPEPPPETEEPAEEPAEELPTQPGINPMEFMEQAKEHMANASPEELEFAMTQFTSMLPEGFLEDRAGEQEGSTTIDVSPVKSKVGSDSGEENAGTDPTAAGSAEPSGL